MGSEMCIRDRIMPDLRYGNTTNVTRPVGTPGINRQAANLGASVQAHTQTQTAAPSFSGIQRPRQPESTVQPMDIKIPDFLKNSRK